MINRRLNRLPSTSFAIFRLNRQAAPIICAAIARGSLLDAKIALHIAVDVTHALAIGVAEPEEVLAELVDNRLFTE